MFYRKISIAVSERWCHMLKSISIEKYASIKKPVIMELGKINYIVGDNSAGKSAICQAIEILFDYSKAYSPNPASFSGNRCIIQGTFLNRFNNDIQVKRIIEGERNYISSDVLEINGRVTNDFATLSSQFKVFLHKTYSLNEFKCGMDLAKFCIRNLTGWSGEIEETAYYYIKYFGERHQREYL